MSSIRNELTEYGLVPRKRLGQHFLVDRNILNKLIRIAEVDQEDVVLEVGPGLGEMTLELVRKAKRVIAVEIDPKMVEVLKKKTTSFPNIKILQKDILEVDFDQLFRQVGKPFKVVANLPYQISTPLLFRFIESRKLFSNLTLMLQKELAERIVALPGSKAYGALSVLTQMASHPSIQFKIKPSAFFPPPKVESVVLQIVWRKDQMMKLEEEDWFRRVVKASFSHRRKTLINSLKNSGLPLPHSIEERMTKVGIDPRRRPETLSIEEFIHLSKALI